MCAHVILHQHVRTRCICNMINVMWYLVCGVWDLFVFVSVCINAHPDLYAHTDSHTALFGCACVQSRTPFSMLPNTTPFIRIRGPSETSGMTQPLYVAERSECLQSCRAGLYQFHSMCAICSLEEQPVEEKPSAPPFVKLVAPWVASKYTGCKAKLWFRLRSRFCLQFLNVAV